MWSAVSTSPERSRAFDWFAHGPVFYATASSWWPHCGFHGCGWSGGRHPDQRAAALQALAHIAAMCWTPWECPACGRNPLDETWDQHNTRTGMACPACDADSGMPV
jgi:hypothetical protein